MPSTTRLNIVYDIWRALSPMDGSVTGLTVPMTTSGGSTTTLVDTGLSRGTAADTHYDGRCVDLISASEESWVTDGGFASATGTLTLSPAVTSIAANANFLVWPRGLGREMVRDEINNVLMHTEAPYLWVPSMVNDPSLESTATIDGSGTDWVTVGSPSTSEMSTTAANILYGSQAIKVVCSADDDGVRSLSFDVTDTEQLLVSVTTRVLTDSLEVVLYDATASSAIKTVTVDERAFTEVRFLESTNAAQEQAQLRFIGTAASSEFYISAPVVVQSTAGYAYAAPSWLTGPEMVRGAFYIPQGFASEDNYSYIAGSEAWRRAPTPQFINVPRYATPLRIQLEGSAQGPVGLVCTRPFATLAADTASTTCDREYLVNKVVANLKRRMGAHKYRQFRDDAAGWSQEAVAASNRARALGYGAREVRITGNPVVVG